MRILLDTHILIQWLADPSPLSPAQIHAIGQAGPDNPMLLSDISLWEIATLHSLGRIALDRPLREWLTDACSPPLVRCMRITPAVAAEVGRLPESFPRDPADRIIVSTTLLAGAVLLTNDSGIREAGVVDVL